MDFYLNTIKDIIISEYGVRFFPKQKKRFREYIIEEMKKLGWDSNIIKGNIVIGDVKKADYIFTAHYDTPGKIPAYIRFFFKLFGNTSFILLFLVMLILYIAYVTIIAIIINSYAIGKILIYLPIIFIYFGLFIPNKNNYTDNTSGVLTLLNLAQEISIKNIDKDKVAFVFFNNEEWGLLGSAEMKKHWKENKINLSGKRIINFDCVGNGDTILITHGKNDKLAKAIKEKLETCNTYNVKTFRYKILPLSDDFNFRDKNAAGIIFCKKAKIGTGFYIPDVHSSKDVILDLNNIELLTNVIIGLFSDKHI